MDSVFRAEVHRSPAPEIENSDIGPLEAAIGIEAVDDSRSVGRPRREQLAAARIADAAQGGSIRPRNPDRIAAAPGGEDERDLLGCERWGDLLAWPGWLLEQNRADGQSGPNPRAGDR